jgi:transposase
LNETGEPISQKRLPTFNELRERIFTQRLKLFKGNVVKAAESLRVSFKTAYNWKNAIQSRKPEGGEN